MVKISPLFHQGNQEMISHLAFYNKILLMKDMNNGPYYALITPHPRVPIVARLQLARPHKSPSSDKICSSSCLLILDFTGCNPRLAA